MKLSELLPEILHIILVHAALGRGVKRALRLRLVCQKFADAVYPALFETHLMDHLWCHPVGTYQWQLQHQHGADQVWCNYLVHRVMGERDAKVGRYVEMRKIAEALCQETKNTENEFDLDLRATVESLCWLALKHGSQDPSEMGRWGPTPKPNYGRWDLPGLKEPEHNANLSLNLLSAAAYFNLLSLAKRLVAEGHNPTDHNRLFAPPIQVAAQNGHVSILRFFQEQLPGSEIEPWSVTGAAIRGDMDILKLALRLLAKTTTITSEQSEDDVYNEGLSAQKFGHIDHATETGKAILNARRYTSNPEVYEYLTSSLAPTSTPLPHTGKDLGTHAQLGNMLMVRHLLQFEVPVENSSGKLASTLSSACRGWHNDIVDLLLEHGADPNFAPERHWKIFPLHESATAGNLTLARKLLDRGALPNRADCGPGRFPALWWAFAQEHTKMIQLLLERGATFHGRWKDWAGKSLADMTYHLGYNSMADILREHGYEIVDPLPYPSRRKGLGWHKWAEARALDPGI